MILSINLTFSIAVLELFSVLEEIYYTILGENIAFFG
jgi:hypothetical protein